MIGLVVCVIETMKQKMRFFFSYSLSTSNNHVSLLLRQSWPHNYLCCLLWDAIRMNVHNLTIFRSVLMTTTKTTSTAATRNAIQVFHKATFFDCCFDGSSHIEFEQTRVRFMSYNKPLCKLCVLLLMLFTAMAVCCARLC